MNYFNYYLDAFKKYATFSGRARRKEFWFFFLFDVIISFAIQFIENSGGVKGTLTGIYALLTIIPFLAISVRRLHDANHSGWWILINIIPLFGWIIYLVFLLTDSYPTENKYGLNPKAEPNKPITPAQNS